MSKSNQLQLLKQKARTELNEREELVPDILEKFRVLIREVDDFQCPLEDAFLLRFLRARKFNLEKALKQLKRYYEMRQSHDELFQNLHPKALQSALEHKLQIVLGRRDSQGRHIFIFRAGEWNPDKISLDDVFRCNYLVLEEMTSAIETQVHGVIAIVDFSGFSFYQARQFTPKHAQRMVQVIQDSFPCRFQEFHLVNQPYFLNVVFSLVKPFLSEKIRRRIHFHGQDMSYLHSIVKKEILPSFLGGSVKWENDWSTFNTKLHDKDDYYKRLCQYGFHKGPLDDPDDIN